MVQEKYFFITGFSLYQSSL